MVHYSINAEPDKVSRLNQQEKNTFSVPGEKSAERSNREGSVNRG